MLLRRLTRHIKDQDWFAVGIDFIIVIVGVFIGIQVANWNEAQKDKAGLAASLERLHKEVAQNIGMIEKVLNIFEGSRDDLDLGRDALNDCAYSPEAQAALERLLFDFVEDVQPNFITVALDRLARQDRYQDLLSPQFQDDFMLYAGRLNEENEQLTSHYEKMWSHHVDRHPDVSAFFSADTKDYVGWGFSLNRPFAEVCVDASFRNRFINTIGFYNAINRRLIAIKAEAERFQIALAEELKLH